MTVQNAIKILKTEYLGDSEYMKLAKQMGAYALEKQIPKKPDFVDYDNYYFECSCCKNAIYSSSNLTDHKFCIECGQALDWSDYNEL